MSKRIRNVKVPTFDFKNKVSNNELQLLEITIAAFAQPANKIIKSLSLENYNIQQHYTSVMLSNP
jgi:hypothetical protein